ncbi:MAG: calcium/sodium antiporter [Acidobacteria bacterium]|nr:calcium/sodium antiporter [Acidobacteriota bacterium]
MGIFLLIAAGLALLAAGAELLVSGSSKLALHLKVPALVVGLTVVAFGTSAPEMVVSISSNMRGSGDIAVGNVVGSNLFNIAVILGLAALIRPLKANLKILRIDMPIVVAATLLVPVLLWDDRVGRLEGAALFCGIVGYTVFTILYGKKEAEKFHSSALEERKKGPLGLQILFILGGLFGLVLGSRLFVDGAVGLAERFQVSEAIIGLTIVAAGTSLPELATSVMAAVRKEEDIAVGNILGSNIFNILSILGLTAWISPVHVENIGMFDLGAMVVLTLFLLPLIRTGYRITRLEGLMLLVLYGVYLYRLWP